MVWYVPTGYMFVCLCMFEAVCMSMCVNKECGWRGAQNIEREHAFMNKSI